MGDGLSVYATSQSGKQGVNASANRNTDNELFSLTSIQIIYADFLTSLIGVVRTILT